MATATGVLVPLEEYLHANYEPDREWVDGELKERGIPDEYHSAMQRFFLVYFDRLKRELHVRVRPELRLKVSGQRYRVPDVMLLPATAPFRPIAEEAPLLCIEVLSPDDRAGELQEKIEDYLGMNVGAIWVVDPRRRRLFDVDRAGMHPVNELLLMDGRVRLGVDEIFAELDELGEMGRPDESGL